MHICKVCLCLVYMVCRPRPLPPLSPSFPSHPTPLPSRPTSWSLALLISCFHRSHSENPNRVSEARPEYRSSRSTAARRSQLAAMSAFPCCTCKKVFETLVEVTKISSDKRGDTATYRCKGCNTAQSTSSRYVKRTLQERDSIGDVWDEAPKG